MRFIVTKQTNNKEKYISEATLHSRARAQLTDRDDEDDVYVISNFHGEL